MRAAFRRGLSMSGGPELDSLNSVKYLFLRELSEPRDNSLRIVVQEAVDNRSAPKSVPTDIPGLTEILKDAWPIESVEGCKSFELSWERYAAYFVTEELVGSAGSYEDETYTGRLLRVYTKSHFLDYLTRHTGGQVKPIQHYKLICLNHLIDVASYTPPEVRLVGSAPPPSLRIQ
jgi:hypothetical protein